MNLKRLIYPTMVLGAAFLTACSGGTASSSQAEEQKQPAIDTTAFDESVKLSDNFYLHVNGGWMKKNPLPASDSRYGAFDVLRDTARNQVRRIVDELLLKEYEKGSNEYRIATLYRQAMDSVTRNKLGAEPLKADLEEIVQLKDKDALVDYAIRMDQVYGNSTLFGSYVAADDQNSEMNIFHLYQTGLGLGNRDYYVVKNEENDKILAGYRAYLEKVSQLAGYSEEEAKAKVDNMLRLEHEIAEIAYSQEKLRDRKLNYNIVNISAFAKENPGFPWAKYFEDRKLGIETADFGQLEYFKQFSKWFAAKNLDELKDYLLVSEINGAAGYLSDDFVNARFDFFGKQLSGRKEIKPRWERAVGILDGSLGEALGEIYVKKYFSPAAKEKMKTLIGNLQKALAQRIESLEWMGAETKEKAHAKLSNFRVKIGYPDKWQDYSSMEIDADKSYYENLKAVGKYAQADNLKDLGKPVDREKWLMNPQTVNAYYMPTTNEICFPAAILQPPFFNINADDAVNYGAIGVVIGHEMTHGFDDQGSLYDKDGNMKDWWTAEDRAKFEAATKKLIAQYSANEILPGLFANGALTVGENIADQGGLLVSFLAMQMAQGDKEVAPIDGFTPEQRFFIGYARIWGQNITDQEIRRLTKLDPHSLGRLRVNQAVKNLETFYKAFDIKEGEPMYIAPEERVLVW